MVGGSHCAGAGALWRGGAIGQLRRGRLRVGPSFERRGLDELPRRRRLRERRGLEVRPKGGGGWFRGRWGLGKPPQRRRAQGKAGLGEAGSRRRALGRRATEEARSEQALGGAKPALSRYCREGALEWAGQV